MFNAMNIMYEDDLKNVKVQCQKKFNDYFKIRSLLKEKLEAIEDNVKEAEA